MWLASADTGFDPTSYAWLLTRYRRVLSSMNMREPRTNGACTKVGWAARRSFLYVDEHPPV